MTESKLMLVFVALPMLAGLLWFIVRKIGKKESGRGMREIFRKGRKL